MKMWHVPADRAADAALDEAWRRLTFGHEGAEQDLIVKGHVIHVPKTAMGAARFTFEELCGRPLGAADYLRIAREYHTIVLDHVPVMTYETRNEAKRFIALIDTLYDNAVKLVASAEAEPDALYRANEGFEAREFKRTASRLVEMGSQAYLALPHGRRASAAATWTDKIVETWAAGCRRPGAACRAAYLSPGAEAEGLGRPPADLNGPPGQVNTRPTGRDPCGPFIRGHFRTWRVRRLP
jgi:cell division protein ZapE